VEEYIDEDEETLPQVWIVGEERLVHFLNSIMFKNIKVDDDIWVLSEDGADGPVASEFCQAKVVKKNKATNI
jgi:hypothetical protein